MDTCASVRPLVADAAIRSVVQPALDQGTLWPEPLPRFNPSFERRRAVAAATDLPPAGVHRRYIVKGYSLSVYTTLDQGLQRVIALDPSVAAARAAERRPIYANVFSSASGQAFICVSRRNDRLEPRELHERSDADFGPGDGYLIVGTEIWDPRDDSEFLPEAWVRRTSYGSFARQELAEFFPTWLNFNAFGECSELRTLPWWGWFMKAPLLFDPTDLPPEPFPRLVPR